MLPLRRAVDDPALDALLRSVSRSFYLSLAVLPRAVRAQLSLAYLVARAADTIADTEAVPRAVRLGLLAEVRAALVDGGPAAASAAGAHVREGLAGGSSPPAERTLLEHLDDLIGAVARLSPDDRTRALRVLDELLGGMERDLERFDGVHLGALATLADLDAHCYAAAGCVGRYWTETTAAHVPSVRHLAAPALVDDGVRLGKFLQLVNVLRDAPADLAGGRCYLPAEVLGRHGLAPSDLRAPERRRRARPVLDELRRIALDHADAAWVYVKAVPPTAPRLRLACIWPLWIGLETLTLLAKDPDPLDEAIPHKITRRVVYRIVAESSAVATMGPLLDRLHTRRRFAAATAL